MENSKTKNNEIKKLLIFDIDGVLIDVSQSYRRAIKETVQFFANAEVSDEEIQQYKNKGGYNNDWDLTEAVLKSRGYAIEKKIIIKKFQELYLGKLIKNETWLLDKKMLAELSKKYILAIFTGRPRYDATLALSINGASPYFSAMMTMDDVQQEKPSPEGLLKILDILQKNRGKANIKEAIYFGDAVDDMQAAKNAGIVGIGVLPPSQKSAMLTALLKKSGAKAVLDNINEIKKVL